MMLATLIATVLMQVITSIPGAKTFRVQGADIQLTKDLGVTLIATPYPDDRVDSAMVTLFWRERGVHIFDTYTELLRSVTAFCPTYALNVGVICDLPRGFDLDPAKIEFIRVKFLKTLSEQESERPQ